jgi:uncharacterized membrane protein YcaP (DUF421 family)
VALLANSLFSTDVADKLIMNSIQNSMDHFLGLGVVAQQLTFAEMSFRSVIVVVATVAMIRLAGRRFIAQRNPLDVMLAFILGSMLARDINGSCAFFATLGAGFVIALLYRAMAFWAYKSDSIGRLLKGVPEELVKDGEIRPHAMLRHQISHNDLAEDLHLIGHAENVGQVKLARIERSGDISVLRKPQIYTVNVEKGVQTIQIQIA